jgi:hypothetical protein
MIRQLAFRRFRSLLVFAVLLLTASTPDGMAAPAPDPERAKDASAVLSEQPCGLGRPVTDRAAWDQLTAQGTFSGVIPQAGQLLDRPSPAPSDDLYLEYSRTGNRTSWQEVEYARRDRLMTLVLAECMEDRGRFLPAIEELIEVLCAERTWVLPAHDEDLANFNGTTTDIDLASSPLAWNLATADYLLAPRLGEATRRRIREEVSRRVLDPFEAMLAGTRPPNGWMLATNNWNAVCLAGVVGAALEQRENREDRARFVVAAEDYSRNYLAGFTADGYCSEGVDYWNYGFGHCLFLAETVLRVTGGTIDLMAAPGATAAASYGRRIQIMNGVCPAFADCGVQAHPLILTPDSKSPPANLYEAMIRAFPQGKSAVFRLAEAPPDAGLRSWFREAGVLIGRPAPGSACLLGVALKGGNNAEQHNHNDIGSFVVVSRTRPVLLDPGGETYTARTFSSRRYESKLINSFGHPVPVVAGQLQRTGREAEARVVRARFTDSADTLVLDIRSAYSVPDLKSLERTFVYSREGTGSLTVTDHVEFKSPQSFGDALITLGAWQRLEDGHLVISDMAETLRVTIEADGAAYSLEPEIVRENAPVTPTRLGINLTHPVTKATITVRIEPLTR